MSKIMIKSKMNGRWKMGKAKGKGQKSNIKFQKSESFIICGKLINAFTHKPFTHLQIQKYNP